MNCPHCKTEIDEHEASRCLDAWVAEAVTGEGKQGFLCPDCGGAHFGTSKGERICHGPPFACGWSGPSLDASPSYSTDIAAAWEVVGRLKENGIGLIIWTASDVVQAYRDKEDGDYLADEKAKVPLAICRAALKAVYVGEDKK